MALSPSGFQRKRLPELLQELQDLIRATFGNDVDVAPQSLFGLIAALCAAREASLWELLEEVYLSQFAGSAEGVSLDGAALLVGIKRLGAAPSLVTGSLTGVEGTVVPIDSVVRAASDQFKLLSAVSITRANADRAVLSIAAPTVGATYQVILNGVTVSVVAGSSIASQICLQLSDAINAQPLPMSAGVVGNTLQLIADGPGVNVTAGAGLSIAEVATAGEFQSIANGSIAVDAGVLTAIVTPVTGWSGIENRIAGTAGRLIETDGEYRLRMREAVRGLGSGSPAAIAAKLPQRVRGLISASIYENTSDTADSVGRPPHSYEVVVTGGSDADVAAAVWATKPAGIQLFGSTTLSTLDANGIAQTVKFSRPAPLYVWVRVQIDAYNSEEMFPTNGPQLVAEAVANLGNQSMDGEDVIRQRLLAAVYSVPGISDVTITLATSATADGPPGVYAAVNLAVPIAARAVFDPARVTVA